MRGCCDDEGLTFSLEEKVAAEQPDEGLGHPEQKG
jgi:hypothetical protein